MAKRIAQADVVIGALRAPEGRTPCVVTDTMVSEMKYGSVIVDMAAEQGGNCELTQEGKIVQEHGVKIVGVTNLASCLATNASDLYAKNVYNLLMHLANSEKFVMDMEEEITKATWIVNDGKIIRS